MTLRHLRIFSMVAETQNMTAAAQKLNMSQPPVSQCISEMEAHYGVKLFDRIGRGIVLTAAGMELREMASHILSLTEEAERRLASLRLGGLLRIGASMTVGTTVLPELLKAYSARSPNSRFFVAVDNSATIVEQLLKAELDIGIIEGESTHSSLVVRRVCEDEMVLIAAAEHGWVLNPPRDIEELAGKGFLVRESGSGTRETFEAAMLTRSVSWENIGVVNNTEAIIRLVSLGLGFSFISRRLAEEARARALVSIINVQGLRITRQFNVIHHRNKFLNQSMEKFIEMASQYDAAEN